jgi:hypothetical protein
VHKLPLALLPDQTSGPLFDILFPPGSAPPTNTVFD